MFYSHHMLYRRSYLITVSLCLLTTFLQFPPTSPASSNHKSELFFMSLVFVPCFFIHSSLDGHIVCFHDLAIEKNAAVSM